MKEPQSGSDRTQVSTTASTEARVLSPLQSLADKDGRKCLFIIKCSDKSFEISASDKKKKQEWIQGLLSGFRIRRVRGRERLFL